MPLMFHGSHAQQLLKLKAECDSQLRSLRDARDEAVAEK